MVVAPDLKIMNKMEMLDYKINALLSKEPSKVYSQLQCKTTVRPEPPKAETE